MLLPEGSRSTLCLAEGQTLEKLALLSVVLTDRFSCRATGVLGAIEGLQGSSGARSHMHLEGDCRKVLREEHSAVTNMEAA